MKLLDKIDNQNRIQYIDPNDIHGKINDVPTTPDYTEYCIWCNLIVEKTSRLKNQAGGTSEDKVYSIFYDLSRSDNGTEYVSFMQGKDAERYNFLSTDYTNIDFNEIKKRNIIEGLQIENISISFANYQTPMVTIKFIDIRGGGFFGREEATHNGSGRLSNLEAKENNKIFDNFFSCFVSFPYPRFRLQVKGFYGKPVTYQLSCTNFNGRFNAQTGNFEITTQFIGYEYGILGDIPFDFLVAAPLTEFGNEYWNTQVANMDKNGWALDAEHTEAPCRLFDFYNNIASATQGNTDKSVLEELIVDEAVDKTIAGISQQKSYLGEILSNINNFKKSVRKVFGDNNITECKNTKEEVMIIHSPVQVKGKNSDTQIMCRLYNILAKSIETYISKYGESNNTITSRHIPNCNENGAWSEWQQANISFTRFVEYNSGGIPIIVALDADGKQTKPIINEQTSCTNTKINKLNCDDEYVISDGMSCEIYKHFEKSTNKNNQFALAIDFGGITDAVNNLLTELTIQQNEYSKQLKDQNRKSISDIVGFTPYIGRYFKVVMCHLETFVELINKCAEAIDNEIDGGKRVPSKMGIFKLTQQTDVPGDVYKQVPPFPSVFKNYTSEAEADAVLNNGKTIVADTWIGDFRGTTEWQEKVLVENLFRAIQRITTARSVTDETVTSNEVSKTHYTTTEPIDYYLDIPQYAYKTKDGAMFYAALRAEVALNFMQNGGEVSDDVAEKMGMLDAFNYYRHRPDKALFTALFSGMKVEDELYKSTVYNGEYANSEKHLYEITKVHNERHPVFVENNDNVTYTYMTNDETGNEIVPLDNFEKFEKNNEFSVHYNYTNGKDFTPKEKTSENYLLGSKSDELIDNYGEYNKIHQFDIIDKRIDIVNIRDAYQDCLDNSYKIINKGSKDFSKTLDRHMLVNKENINKYYDGKPTNGFSFYKEYGIEANDFSQMKNDDSLINKFLTKVKK